MQLEPSRTDAGDGQLSTLVQEIAQLRDLFQRRLFEDKAKNRLYEELHEQVSLARGALADQLLTPIFRDLLLVIDRISGLANANDVVLRSVVDELLELLERRGVRPVSSMAAFDAQLHEAVGTQNSDLPEGTVLKIARRGYLMGDRLLRPEQVVIASNRQRDRTDANGQEQERSDALASPAAYGLGQDDGQLDR